MCAYFLALVNNVHLTHNSHHQYIVSNSLTLTVISVLRYHYCATQWIRKLMRLAVSITIDWSIKLDSHLLWPGLHVRKSQASLIFTLILQGLEIPMVIPDVTRGESCKNLGSTWGNSHSFLLLWPVSTTWAITIQHCESFYAWSASLQFN